MHAIFATGGKATNNQSINQVSKGINDNLICDTFHNVFTISNEALISCPGNYWSKQYKFRGDFNLSNSNILSYIVYTSFPYLGRKA